MRLEVPLQCLLLEVLVMVVAQVVALEVVVAQVMALEVVVLLVVAKGEEE